MIPGDSFDFHKVERQFSEIRLIDQELKNSSYDYYESYCKINECDTYKFNNEGVKIDVKEKMKLFLEGFNEFVTSRVDRVGFNKKIIGFKVHLQCEDNCSEVVIGGNSHFNGKVAKFSAPKEIMTQLLCGSIDWENLYIGYGEKI